MRDDRQRSKLNSPFRGIPANFGLANWYFPHCFIGSSPLPRLDFMILVAIFSVIILVLCWLCASGDCNN